MKPTRVLLAVVIAAMFGACSTEPGDTSTARMRCQQPGTDNYFACELTLQERGGFEVVLDYTECQAQGNTLRLTKPTVQVLTDNGCFTAAGTVWSFPGPYNAGTAVAMEIEGPRQPGPADLRVQGAWPSWTLLYEDGADEDYDDLILKVNGLPE